MCGNARENSGFTLLQKKMIVWGMDKFMIGIYKTDVDAMKHLKIYVGYEINKS